MELFQNKHFIADYAYLIRVTLPKTYSSFPKVKDDALPPCHYTFKDVNEWFTMVHDRDLRIREINEISFEEEEEEYCQYCNAKLDYDLSYHCMHCRRKMCKLCHGETSEEIALANGARNYHKRKNKLDECHKANQIVERDRVRSDTIKSEDHCNLCQIQVYQFIESNGNLCEWYTAPKEIFKICPSCSQTDRGIKLIEEHKFVHCTLLYDLNEYGSFLDWIPIIEDDDGNLVLVNCNPDSTNFNRTSLSSVDNHGRMGFYSTELSLDEIISKLNEYSKNNSTKKLTGWDKFNDQPIKLLMRELDMPTHYG